MTKKKGRKWILSPAIIDKASRLLAAGNYVQTVCEYMGISQSAWYRWYNTGEELKDSDKKRFTKEEQLQIDFYEAISKANATAEIRAINSILEAGQNPKNWTANAWYLERRFADKWGRKDKIEHSGGLSNINKNIDLSNLSDEDLEKELKKYE